MIGLRVRAPDRGLSLGRLRKEGSAQTPGKGSSTLLTMEHKTAS